MNVRRTRSLLWLASTVLVVGAAVTLALGLWLPPKGVVTDDPLKSTNATTRDRATDPVIQAVATTSSSSSSTPSNLGSAAVWQRTFRGPLYDPPPPPKPAPAPPPPPPPLRIKLLGTAVENDPSQSQAIVTDSRGQMRFARIGETIEEATITQIDAASVSVQFHGEARILTLDSKEAR